MVLPGVREDILVLLLTIVEVSDAFHLADGPRRVTRLEKIWPEGGAHVLKVEGQVHRHDQTQIAIQ